MNGNNTEKSRKKRRIAVFVVVPLCLIFLAFNYFFHASVLITSRYKISNVAWRDIATTEEHKPVFQKFFNHYCSYQVTEYSFDLKYDNRVIPVYISIFKTDNWRHEDYKFNIYYWDSPSDINVDVYIDGSKAKSECYDAEETEMISIGIGP